MTKSETQRIAELTQDAYSRPRYTDAGWTGIIRDLAAAGATEAEIRWILESKHTRWAADAANRNHSATAADFQRYAFSPHVGSYEKLIRTAQIDLEHQAKRRESTDPRPTLAGVSTADLLAEIARRAK